MAHLRAVLRLAEALERGDHEEVARVEEDLCDAPAVAEVESDEPSVVPVTRAKVLASALIDLARSAWSVSVEDRQVYVAAPEWSDGGRGLSPAAVLEEKARARAAMSARVDEEVTSEATRRFIRRMESPRATEDGVRSVLSLVADGARLAAALRAQGASAIRPYLYRADIDAPRDPTTGLAAADIFRYFRLTWSFPTNTPPGRSIAYLIRDEGQPGHPVCGLICVASPVPRLSARDAALGWSSSWIEACVVAFEAAEEGVDRLREVAEAWRALPEHDGGAASIVADVSALLGLVATSDPDRLGAALAALDPQERARRVDGARKRVLVDLRREIEDALGLINFDRFGFSRPWALTNPAKASTRLETLKEVAYREWRESRRMSARAGAPNERVDRASFNDAHEMRAAARQPLFFKKRVTQAADLLRAWQELRPRAGERPAERLRALVLGDAAPSSVRLTGGARVAKGVRFALLQRQNRLLASQALDVCICGAIPPYGPLLGGKLAALAALSRDVAADYHARYADRPSEITSQMAGEAFTRPADLLAMTTTSFYGVGSSQYERLSIPTADGEVRWRLVGRTRGNGTLHFSRRTSGLIDDLLCTETGRRLITSRFGEGPSERLRKIRDGLERLGVDANELLRHGMPRLVYLAELAPGATRPGSRAMTSPWREVGPSMEDVADHWRDRWLKNRLRAKPELIDDLERFNRVGVLLSGRLRRRRGGVP